MRTLYHNLIPGLWLLWLAGWTISAFRTKPVLRAEGVGLRLSHLIPLGLGIVLLVFRHAGGAWLETRLFPRTVWSFWIGAALVALGLGFAAWARIHLAGNWSGTVTLKHDHSLTRTGPYRLVRHPIYTGLLTAILGSSIAEDEWRGLLAFVLITVSFVRKLTIEERFLTAQFGEVYTRYRAEVPPLVPWLPRRRRTLPPPRL
jgi:protein-S-isoprenylcysteine O-methyltransferase Ste14